MTRRDAEIYYGKYHAGEKPRCLARVADNEGTNITQSDVSSIAWSLWDMSDTSAAVASGTLLASNVITDTPTDDAAWTVDDTGFNFAWTWTDDTSNSGGKTLRSEVVITLTSGEIIVLIFEGRFDTVYSLAS
ncbi:MAG TPA: hypothetical protein VMY42_28800 [Thermoguttaceae bacterium]|nr:hypothetical protein [Thermoguttaceae bacterium]